MVNLKRRDLLCKGIGLGNSFQECNLMIFSKKVELGSWESSDRASLTVLKLVRVPSLMAEKERGTARANTVASLDCVLG